MNLFDHGGLLLNIYIGFVILGFVYMLNKLKVVFFFSD